MTVLDTVNRVYREFKRYTGDGEPNEPSGAPLPVGDPQSGPHSPKKSELRAMFLEVLEAASDDADAAAAALAELERLYLGAKAEDPATDNEGGVLETGALYFNTVDSKFRVWTAGDVWQDQSTALADGGVTEPKLATGGVSTRALADLAVTEGKLATALALKINQVQTGWDVGISVPASPAADCVADAQALIDATPDGGVIVIPPNTYRISTLPVDGAALWTSGGDAALGLPSDIGILFNGRRDLKVDARGSTFIVDEAADGFAVARYKCVGVEWVGGSFVGNSTLKAGAGEAVAIATIRSLRSPLRGVRADSFYRNLLGYRSTLCVMEECEGNNGGYFGIYLSGLLDVATGILASETLPPDGYGYWEAKDCTMLGNKYANAFSQDAIWRDCHFLNPGRQGNYAAQWRGERGYNAVFGGEAIDTSDQNSGDVVDGFLIAAGSDAASSGIYPTGAVHGVKFVGHRIAIDTIGAIDLSVSGNRFTDWALAGISARSDYVGGAAYPMRGIAISGNIVGRRKSGSTVSPFGSVKRAGIQLEVGGDPVQDCWGTIVGNIVNAHASAPDGTYYEIATNMSLTGANLSFAGNRVKGAGVNSLAP